MNTLKRLAPSLWCVFYGVLAVVLLAYGLFVLNELTDRILAILLGLHFGNRSEIAELKAALKARAA